MMHFESTLNYQIKWKGVLKIENMLNKNINVANAVTVFKKTKEKKKYVYRVVG